MKLLQKPRQSIIVAEEDNRPIAPYSSQIPAAPRKSSRSNMIVVLVVLLALTALVVSEFVALGDSSATGGQRAGTLLFVPLLALALWWPRRAAQATTAQPASSLPTRTLLAWMCRAAIPAALLAAVSEYLTRDLAPVPLLWVVPLGLYLATWIVAFAPAGAALVRFATRAQDVTADSAQGVVIKGYLAYDENLSGKRPGVLVVHEWWGVNDEVRRRARMLAELGYTALALDMYGEGKEAVHPGDGGKFSSELMKNIDVAKARFLAALDYLKQQPTVDPNRIAAIGYCFGVASC